MDGRALDRNPLVGSGGLNTPSSAYSFDGGFRARSLITGNLTGLASFHGQTQLLQGNSFRGGLPSSGLSGFTARSVGLGQVRSGRALAPTSYLGTQETIPDLGFIRRGLNRPGSSQLISPLTRRPLATVQEARSKLLNIRDPAATIAGVRPELSTYSTRQRPLGSPADAAGHEAGALGRVDLTPAGAMGGVATPAGYPFGASSSGTSPFGLAADSSIFGSPGPASFRSPVTGERITPEAHRSIKSALLSRTLDRPIDSRRTPAGSGAEGDTLPGGSGSLGGVTSDGAAVPKSRPPGGRSASTGGRLADGRPADPRSTGAGTTGWSDGQRDARAAERDVFTSRGRGSLSATTGLVTGLTARPAALGADKFADIVSAVQAAQASGAPRLGFLAGAGMADDGSTPSGFPAAPGDRGGAVATEGQSPLDGSARPRGDGVKQLATAVRWADKLLDDPIKSFVGMHRDRLNDYMRRAEEALHGGKFYDAARLFDLAHTVDPANPLPLLGRGHALLAAGDYMSGEFSLERGLSRFPQIVAFRLDLPALVGRHDTYDLRRLDLEKRLESRDHYKLRFVLGYLELYSGLEEQGLRNLRQAADLAPAESVIAIFPDLLLGRRELPKVGRRLR